jgi:hypothetical protein
VVGIEGTPPNQKQISLAFPVLRGSKGRARCAQILKTSACASSTVRRWAGKTARLENEPPHQIRFFNFCAGKMISQHTPPTNLNNQYNTLYIDRHCHTDGLLEQLVFLVNVPFWSALDFNQRVPEFGLRRWSASFSSHNRRDGQFREREENGRRFDGGLIGPFTGSVRLAATKGERINAHSVLRVILFCSA